MRLPIPLGINFDCYHIAYLVILVASCGIEGVGLEGYFEVGVLGV